MRAELPWNVAGIPPEAREAARAAARREGLSVGEWLTRRILRSFSDMGEDPQPLPIDPWGLPQSSTSRRDTEDMLARVSRSENESSDVYRRIEDQLRNVARRLDGTERSQSESNRVMTKTATEINIATREQAQAFDQLGGHVMGLSDRLERLERNAAQDGLKDAVKGLHQGLSRLADQITQTANHSATQVSSLAGNLEQLAARLGQARTDAETANKVLEQRISAVEKAAQFTTNALDHALEKLEAQATIRAGDLAEIQKRDTAAEVSIMRLEESIGRLEKRDGERVTDRRLENVERALSGIVQRLDDSAPVGPVQEAVRGLTRRLDGLEATHNEFLAEQHKPQAQRPAPDPPAPEPAAFLPEPPTFEAPPFAEPEAAPAFDASPTFDASPVTAEFNPANPYAYAPDALANDAFANGGFEMPPEFAAALGQSPAAGDYNFLNAARRSARAAAQAESDRGGTFRWGKTTPDHEAAAPKAKPNYLVPALLLLILLFAILGGVVLLQRVRPPASTPPGKAAHTTAPAAQSPVVTAPATPSIVPFTPAPEGTPAPEARRLPLPKSTAPATAGKTPTAKPQTVKPAATAPAPAGASAAPQAPAQPGTAKPAAANAAPPALNVAPNRVTQLADGGNVIAETIVGLGLLDGSGVVADPAAAAKYLQRAADQGQAVAQYRLGTMYERGLGVTADPAKAAKWYQASADQGNRKAMHNLAVAYADGAIGKKDMAEAARWFSKAAALGLPDSQFNLAVLYERGDGVPQSLLDAFKWYSIAAAGGDAESKTRLTVLSTQLSDSDRAAAQKSAATFHASALNRAANVPPVAADLPAK